MTCPQIRHTNSVRFSGASASVGRVGTSRRAPSLASFVSKRHDSMRRSAFPGVIDVWRHTARGVTSPLHHLPWRIVPLPLPHRRLLTAWVGPCYL